MRRFILSVLASLLTCSLFACQAITAKGTVCKRSGEPYCWQHQKLTGKSYSTSSSATATTTVSKTKYTGKSYDVYNQRNAQGARTFSKKMRQQKFDEQGGKCAYCSKQCSSISDMHGDHIVPYSKGGKTEYSNLQMLCPTCNLKKSDK